MKRNNFTKQPLDIKRVQNLITYTLVRSSNVPVAQR